MHRGGYEAAMAAEGSEELLRSGIKLVGKYERRCWMRATSELGPMHRIAISPISVLLATSESSKSGLLEDQLVTFGRTRD